MEVINKLISNKIFNNQIFNLVVRLFLGGMFITVAITKIPNPEKFANEIGNYNILPEILINLSALILPWVELSTGFLLIFGHKIKESSIIISLLLFTFTAAILSAMFRGLDINCGCYSEIAQKKVGWEKIFENIGLIILSIYVYLSNANINKSNN